MLNAGKAPRNLTGRGAQRTAFQAALYAHSALEPALGPYWEAPLPSQGAPAGEVLHPIKEPGVALGRNAPPLPPSHCTLPCVASSGAAATPRCARVVSRLQPKPTPTPTHTHWLPPLALRSRPLPLFNRWAWLTSSERVLCSRTAAHQATPQRPFSLHVCPAPTPAPAPEFASPSAQVSFLHAPSLVLLLLLVPPR